MKRTSLIPLLAIAAGCFGGSDTVSTSSSTAVEPMATVGHGVPSTKASAARAPERVIGESDFDPHRNRDPFEPQDVPEPRTPPVAEGPFADRPVTQLRVVGTATGKGGAHAMLSDGQGTSKVVTVGARVGQDLKQRDGGVVRWTVDHIREGEVILRGEQVYGGDGTPKTLVIRS